MSFIQLHLQSRTMLKGLLQLPSGQALVVFNEASQLGFIHALFRSNRLLLLGTPAVDLGKTGYFQKRPVIDDRPQRLIVLLDLRVDPTPPHPLWVFIPFKLIDRSAEQGFRLMTYSNTPTFQQ